MKIALVSVTLNATNPMTDFLRTQPDVSVRNYLDSYLLEKIRAEGKVSDACVARMFTMLSNAVADGAEGIIIVCTVFSQFVEGFSKLLSVPIIAADNAMMEQVGAIGGKTALLCTFSGTRDASTNLLTAKLQAGRKPYLVDTFVLNDAFACAEAGDFTLHDRLIQQKMRELDTTYDNIVLAQMSMAHAAEGINLSHARVFTSPKAAYETLCLQLA